MPDIDIKQFWETLKSSGAQTSLLVALMGQVGTAIYFQIVNNERQEAAIAANHAALQEWMVRDANLNTTFGQKFVRLEETVNGAITRSESLQTPIGQRFIVMETKANEAIALGMERVRQTERMEEQLRILVERVNLIDRRLLEMDLRMKEQPK